MWPLGLRVARDYEFGGKSPWCVVLTLHRCHSDGLPKAWGERHKLLLFSGLVLVHSVDLHGHSSCT